jgi:hypothetical protein
MARTEDEWADAKSTGALAETLKRDLGGLVPGRRRALEDSGWRRGLNPDGSKRPRDSDGAFLE